MDAPVTAARAAKCLLGAAAALRADCDEPAEDIAVSLRTVLHLLTAAQAAGFAHTDSFVRAVVNADVELAKLLAQRVIETTGPDAFAAAVILARAGQKSADGEEAGLPSLRTAVARAAEAATQKAQDQKRD